MVKCDLVLAPQAGSSLSALSCLPSTSTRQLDRRPLPQKTADSVDYNKPTIASAANISVLPRFRDRGL